MGSKTWNLFANKVNWTTQKNQGGVGFVWCLIWKMKDVKKRKTDEYNLTLKNEKPKLL